MNKLYFTKAEGIYDRLDGILKEFLGYSPQILRTENGKPYIDGTSRCTYGWTQKEKSASNTAR